jgi:hypothetical protein
MTNPVKVAAPTGFEDMVPLGAFSNAFAYDITTLSSISSSSSSSEEAASSEEASEEEELSHPSLFLTPLFLFLPPFVDCPVMEAFTEEAAFPLFWPIFLDPAFPLPFPTQEGAEDREGKPEGMREGISDGPIDEEGA